LDDYIKEVEEGCLYHLNGRNMDSIVEGFGGMRIKTISYTFHLKFQKNGEYSFKINFRNQIVTVV
jgi:maltose phosphorylase